MNEGCRKCKTTLAPLQSRYCAVMSGDTLKYRNKYHTLRVFNFKLSCLLQGRVHDKLLVVFLRHHDGPPDYRCMMMNTHSQCLCWSDYWTLNPYVAVMRKLVLKFASVIPKTQLYTKFHTWKWLMKKLTLCAETSLPSRISLQSD